MAENTDQDPDEESQSVSFPMPEGFQPPDGTKPGAEFHALATLKVGEDGELNLLALDGAEVQPESEAEPDETQGMAAAVRQKLPATGLPA